MNKVVRIASNEALLSLDAIFGLARFLDSLALPRRRTVDWLAGVIFGWIEDSGVILDGEGREIEITPDTIDDAHGLDGSFKWVSDVRSRTSNPPIRRPRKSILLRLQLYDAAARITAGRSILSYAEDRSKE